ncbi:hypothetical protein [Caloranaerobacter ferrireducens]|uniref:hypothetical protein n=1 Tax=Caloranaerobacter ferrireducens TaxID=1323370 RepID=UPI00084D2736|nr:hypothetical protein [Caloranaerobacter ferrireducens]
MRKILIFSLIITLLFSMTTGVFAIEKNKEDIYNTHKILLVTDKGLQEISIEEYLQKTGKAFNIKKTTTNKIFSYSNFIIKPQKITDDYYVYIENSTGYRSRPDLREIVSNIQHNATSSESQFKIKSSTTVGYEFSGNLNYEEKQAVKIGMSINWNSSESYEETHTITLKPGEYGWAEFEPIMEYTTGTVKHYNWLGTLLDSKTTTLYVPVEKNGKAWGYIHLITSYTKPF